PAKRKQLVYLILAISLHNGSSIVLQWLLQGKAERRFLKKAKVYDHLSQTKCISLRL
ncbi:hypothetical protein GYMLUDRAFT_463230, partial [Collybiopsis luxurians FD-317 M1]